jgi:hypothetical protein
MTTFEEIRKLAWTLYETSPGPLAREVDYMIDASRVNADDTCCVEKSRPMEDYDAVALESLEQACCYAEPHQMDAVAWFVAHGLKF